MIRAKSCLSGAHALLLLMAVLPTLTTGSMKKLKGSSAQSQHHSFQMESASRRLARHVGGSAPLTRYASSPSRLNRLHLDATGTNTDKEPRSSELKTRQVFNERKPFFSALSSHRRDPSKLEISSDFRTLQTLDTRTMTHLFSFLEHRHLAGEHHLPHRSHPP
ncbi:hypothetical protein YC2023_124763 [Brassica napus]